jgi:hypothetical protein
VSRGRNKSAVGKMAQRLTSKFTFYGKYEYDDQIKNDTAEMYVKRLW